MEGAKVKNLLLAAACNVEYDCFDWRGEFVAFGSSDLIHLYHTKSIKTLCAIKGHIGRVNSVKFLKNGDILSACAGGRVSLHRNTHFATSSPEEFLKEESHWTSWDIVSSHDIKNRNILQVSLYQSNETILAVCLTTESDLHLLSIEQTGNKVVVLDRLLFGNNLLESSTLFSFKNTLYLCVSSSDFLVHIYSIAVPKEASSQEGKSFSFLNSLKGHEDKVKALDSVVCTYDGQEVALVVSGSKDNSVRVWRVTETLTDKIQQEFIKKNIYKIGNHFLHLESILHSHSDSVSSVQWAALAGDTSSQEVKLLLLTSSLDFSVQIWQRETQSKVGICVIRSG